MQAARVPLIALVQNEAHLIAPFLAYSRAMGPVYFIIVGGHSTAGTRKLLVAQLGATLMQPVPGSAGARDRLIRRQQMPYLRVSGQAAGPHGEAGWRDRARGLDRLRHRIARHLSRRFCNGALDIHKAAPTALAPRHEFRRRPSPARCLSHAPKASRPCWISSSRAAWPGWNVARGAACISAASGAFTAC